jgi:YesN/AraC family two-component response regulator
MIPDIIISDVMMPEMDGIELCALLKNDIRTSHIPVILLTARTSTVHEVDGLESGADDYVRKPFDSRAIVSRVASQLDNRSKIRKHFYNQVRFNNHKSIKPVSKEEKFIDEVSEIVEKSIHKGDEFSIDKLADDLCMSQSTLYRKVKSLTGLSIVGFVRSMRLKKACEILLTEDIKLSAIAYNVGFNDYKYFKKSFIQQYGVSPKEYRDNALLER